MMRKTLIILVACLVLVPLYAEDPMQPTGTDQLLFNLSQQRLVLDDLIRISEALDILRPHLPAISQLLSSSDSAHSKALLEALKQSQDNTEPDSFTHQMRALEKFVELTSHLEQISKISPDALELLDGSKGKVSLKDILADLMVMPRSQSEKSTSSPEPIKVLFAQTGMADRQASVVLNIGRTIVPLQALKRVPTPTGFVVLSKVVKTGAALVVHLTTEQGDQRIYYP